MGKSKKDGIVMSGTTMHSKNTCQFCGAPAQVVKFAKSREAGRPSGMMWVCKENSEHVSRTRIHELYDPKAKIKR
jgi:hypothetical protein